MIDEKVLRELLAGYELGIKNYEIHKNTEWLEYAYRLKDKIIELNKRNSQ